MKKLLRLLAIAALGIGLTTGMAGAQSGSNDTTGPDSYNTVNNDYTERHRVKNENRVRATNNNPQYAATGDAVVAGNTNGGSATTGEARNDSWTTFSVSNSNTSSSSWNGGAVAQTGDNSNTGPDSYNAVNNNYSVETKVSNTNKTELTNNNSQTAVSGDATVTHNTNAGDAQSGDAENVSTTEITVSNTN